MCFIKCEMKTLSVFGWYSQCAMVTLLWKSWEFYFYFVLLDFANFKQWVKSISKLLQITNIFKSISFRKTCTWIQMNASTIGSTLKSSTFPSLRMSSTLKWELKQEYLLALGCMLTLKCVYKILNPTKMCSTMIWIYVECSNRCVIIFTGNGFKAFWIMVTSLANVLCHQIIITSRAWN